MCSNVLAPTYGSSIFIQIFQTSCEPIMSMWLASNGSLVLLVCDLMILSFSIHFIIVSEYPMSNNNIQISAWVSFFLMHSTPFHTLFWAPRDQPPWVTSPGLLQPMVGTVRRSEHRTRKDSRCLLLYLWTQVSRAIFLHRSSPLPQL